MNFSEKDVVVYNNIFSHNDIIKIQTYLHEPKWEWGQVSHPENEGEVFPFWIMTLEQDFFTKDLFNIITKKLKGKWKINRCYCNGSTFGMEGSFHTDDDHPDTKTVIYYANEYWSQEWGGKTVFALEDKYHYVEPIPNSLVIFPSGLTHRAESVNRQFKQLRTTIAWKLIKDK